MRFNLDLTPVTRQRKRVTMSHIPAETGYIAADFGLSDRNDCVIRAFANVGVDSYVNIRNILFNKGRRQYKGTPVITTHAVAKMYGGVYTAIGQSGAKRDKLAQLYNCGADSMDSRGCTIANISARYPKGRHIVSVRGHVFALINGRIIDTHACRPGTHVVGVFSFPD